MTTGFFVYNDQVLSANRYQLFPDFHKAQESSHLGVKKFESAAKALRYHSLAVGKSVFRKAFLSNKIISICFCGNWFEDAIHCNSVALKRIVFY